MDHSCFFAGEQTGSKSIIKAQIGKKKPLPYLEEVCEMWTQPPMMNDHCHYSRSWRINVEFFVQ